MDELSFLENFDPRLEREKASLSQRAMADALEVTQSAVSKMEAAPLDMSVATLKKWAKACGYLTTSAAAIEVGTPYQRIMETAQIAIRYLSQWNESAVEAPLTSVTPASIAASLKRIIRKPIGVIVGGTDTGKSRLLNTILGGNFLPTSHGSATKLLCILKHIGDRPAEMDATVYLLRNGFDVSSPLDANSIAPYRVKSGGLELLKQYGIYEYPRIAVPVDAAYLRTFAERARTWSQQPERPPINPDARNLEKVTHALIFVDSPILQACDIIDTPGFSGDIQDVELVIQGIRNATFLIHCSSATKYMGTEDLILMQEVVKCLPLMSTSADGSFSNVLLIATMASLEIQDGELDATINAGIDRLAHHLASTLPQAEMKTRLGATVVDCDAERVAEELRRRAYPLLVESTARRAEAIAAIKRQVGQSIPVYHETQIVDAVQDLLQQAETILLDKVRELEDCLANTPGSHYHSDLMQDEQKHELLRDLTQDQQKHTFLVQAKVRKIQSLIDIYRGECAKEVARIAERYCRWQNIRDLCAAQPRRSDGAKVDTTPLILESINREVAGESYKRRSLLEAAIAEEFGPGTGFARFDINIDSLIESTKRVRVESTKRVQVGTIGLGSLIAALLPAAALVPAPIVALGILIAGVNTLKTLKDGSDDKYARDVSAALHQANLYKVLMDSNDAYWNHIEEAFNHHYEEIEVRYKRNSEYRAKVIVTRRNDVSIADMLNHDLSSVKRLIEFLRRMPWLLPKLESPAIV